MKYFLKLIIAAALVSTTTFAYASSNTSVGLHSICQFAVAEVTQDFLSEMSNVVVTQNGHIELAEGHMDKMSGPSSVPVMAMGTDRWLCDVTIAAADNIDQLKIDWIKDYSEEETLSYDEVMTKLKQRSKSSLNYSYSQWLIISRKNIDTNPEMDLYSVKTSSAVGEFN